MRLDITFRQIDASDEIRQWVERRVEKVARFLRPPIEAHVVLREEKFRQIAEVTVKAAGEGAYVASAEAEDIRTAIDLVMHKIESVSPGPRSPGRPPPASGRYRRASRTWSMPVR